MSFLFLKCDQLGACYFGPKLHPKGGFLDRDINQGTGSKLMNFGVVLLIKLYNFSKFHLLSSQLKLLIIGKRKWRDTLISSSSWDMILRYKNINLILDIDLSAKLKCSEIWISCARFVCGAFITGIRVTFYNLST